MISDYCYFIWGDNRKFLLPAIYLIFCWYADVERSWPITMRCSSIWISSDRPLNFSHDVFSKPYPHSPLTSCALSYRHWRWSCYTFPPFFNLEWSCWRRWTFPTYERLVWRFRWVTWHRWWSIAGGKMLLKLVILQQCVVFTFKSFLFSTLFFSGSL